MNNVISPGVILQIHELYIEIIEKNKEHVRFYVLNKYEIRNREVVKIK